ncbi:MAG: DUF1648 domain-containing protein [Phycisphaerae bacterium]|nr:DUF1648 domain-containing protein [Phycisphaerae bacterium]
MNQRGRTEARPKLDLPTTRMDYVLRAVSVGGVMASFALVLVAQLQLPERIPVHFNWRGEADGWGSRQWLWLLPSISLICVVAMAKLSRHPRLFNYPVRITEKNAAVQYRLGRSALSWIQAEISMLFLLLAVLVVRAAQVEPPQFVAWPLIAMLALVLATAFVHFAIMIRHRGA